MTSITVLFRDGTKREFKEVGRPGGSYSLSIKYEGEFIVITDEYYNTTAYPMDRVQEVTADAGTRGRW